MNSTVQGFSLPLNYFDWAVVVWLIIGLLRGRKLGISQEIIPTLKWICIVVLCGLYSNHPAFYFHHDLGFDPVGSNLAAYLLIALLIHVIFSGLKSLLGEKLIASNLFGRWEFYLGMGAGVIRFACLLLVVMSLMTARVYTKEEVDAGLRRQRKELESEFFWTYPQTQYYILTKSFTGKEVTAHLSSILISGSLPPEPFARRKPQIVLPPKPKPASS